MAVVNEFAIGVPDPDAAQPTKTDRRQAHGVVRTLSFRAEITNGDSIASTYVMGRIPSNARILKQSQLHTDAITSATDADLGFVNDPDALIDGATLASATSLAGMSAVNIANMHEKAWQLADLAADPGGYLDVVLTLNAAAGADGDVVLDLLYVTD